MQHITLNLDTAAPLASPEWADLDQRFRRLNPTDHASQTTLVGMVRELVEGLAAQPHRDLLRLIDDPTTPVQLFADFHCDEYGEITNDHHLSLSVMIGYAPLIMDAGIRDIRELPLPHHCTELDVITVLAAVVDYVNTLIRRAVEALTAPAVPARSPAGLPNAANVHVHLERSDFQAQIISDPAPGLPEFVLQWNDYVVNEWSERFDTLSAALIALGILDEAVTSNAGVAFEGLGESVHTVVLRHTA
ncbi:MAG: hypothetical protein DI630_00445 [Gordonia sp. (in: high G+C Gram-positive bacteria)]|nr:MAG: hypothetical protein DI630_00445 [Gordonia sp. (in: high G+C Gram-positive bacteria)]